MTIRRRWSSSLPEFRPGTEVPSSSHAPFTGPYKECNLIRSRHYTWLYHTSATPDAYTAYVTIMWFVIGCPTRQKCHRAEQNVPLLPDPFSQGSVSGSGARD